MIAEFLQTFTTPNPGKKETTKNKRRIANAKLAITNLLSNNLQ